jgi:aromatic ring-opening dioxygenase LigB subunit
MGAKVKPPVGGVETPMADVTVRRRMRMTDKFVWTERVQTRGTFNAVVEIYLGIKFPFASSEAVVFYPYGILLPLLFRQRRRVVRLQGGNQSLCVRFRDEIAL